MTDQEKIADLTAKLEAYEAKAGPMKPKLEVVTGAIQLSELGISQEASDAFETNHVDKILTNGYRVLFFSATVNIDTEMTPELFRKAVEKGLAPNLRRLNEAFKIVGSLAKVSYIKLVNDAGTKWVKENDYGTPGSQEIMDELNTHPPFRYAVFAFPAIERNYPLYGPIQQEGEFMAELAAAGINVSPEGSVGETITLE